MAKTPSKMLPLGTPAPEFSLVDACSGRTLSTKDVSGPKGLLVMFICNHCPFVKHLKDEMADVAKRAQSLGIGVVAINSNDIQEYPEDRPELMAEDAVNFGYTFPYLFDESQMVAKSFDAACTPDFFLFDAQGRLAYRGQFDGSRPGNDVPVTGQDLLQAVNAVALGQRPSQDQRPSLGCNIKWRMFSEAIH